MQFTGPQKHRQGVAMHRAAKAHFKSKRFAMERTAVLSSALAVCQENAHIQDRRELQRLVEPEVKRRLRSAGFTGPFLTALLWWLIPKLVEWLIIRWINGEFSDSQTL